MQVPANAGTLVELAAAVRSGHRTPSELVEQALDRMSVVQPYLNAFTSTAAERAQEEAAALTAEASAGRWRGPLHGVPVAVKDLFDVAGEVTGAGSKLPPTGRTADVDAEAVRRVRAAGAVVIGRTRTHEYAWGLTTQHDVLGGTRNPYDTDRVPGGSSGGSAAAVAAGVVPLALGSDTAGSIRLPAAWCGLVGHKPTHGRVSLAGMVPLAPTLDHAGALVRTVPDARLALAVLTGDSFGRKGTDLQGIRIGRPVDPSLPAGDDAVDRVVANAAATAASAGASIQAVAFPQWRLLRKAFVVLQGEQAVRYHRSLGHWPDRAERYDAGVRSRLAAADGLSAADVEQAQGELADLRRDVLALFDEVDVLLQPVAGTGPSRVDDPDVVLVNGQPADLREQVLPHTLLASLCGLPACSVPAGVDADGLPVGVQVIGPPHRDDLVLDVAQLVHEMVRPRA